jgi:hypothetical protein
MRRVPRKFVAFSLVLAVSLFGAQNSWAATKKKPPVKNSLSIELVSENLDWRTSPGATETAAKIASTCGNWWGGKLSFKDGTQVRIKNESDKLIGIGKLAWKVTEVKDTHLIDPNQTPANSPKRYIGVCVFTSTVKNLAKSQMYQVLIGSQDAGVYEFSELVATKWKLTLSQ